MSEGIVIPVDPGNEHVADEIIFAQSFVKFAEEPSDPADVPPLQTSEAVVVDTPTDQDPEEIESNTPLREGAADALFSQP